jgi:hypothetical protein
MDALRTRARSNGGSIGRRTDEIFVGLKPSLVRVFLLLFFPLARPSFGPRFGHEESRCGLFGSGWGIDGKREGTAVGVTQQAATDTHRPCLYTSGQCNPLSLQSSLHDHQGRTCSHPGHPGYPTTSRIHRNPSQARTDTRPTTNPANTTSIPSPTSHTQP